MPIPRPSWPRRYTITPAPSSSMRRIASWSCSPQSHFTLENTSPVMHSLCTLTSTSDLAGHVPLDERQVGVVAVDEALERVAAELAPDRRQPAPLPSD